ncbi:MAG TPA: PoNe immunity protein domain-containing protein [Pseudomonas sp.]|nr:PoNe immunity protein domain-containing protein [Pseudomonas sp.]
MKTFQLDVEHFIEEFLWRGTHFNLLADKDLEAALYACEELNVHHENDEFYSVPADSLYQLPQSILLFGHSTSLVSVMLGNVFLVFRGRLAESFASELSLTFDDLDEIPRPCGLAGLLDVYVETAEGRYEVVADEDIERLMADGSVYDTLYCRDEEVPDGIMFKQRQLIAYESSRFPGFTLLGTQHAARLSSEAQAQFSRMAEEDARKQQLARATIDAEINCSADENKINALMRSSDSPEPGDAFLIRRRQRFLTEDFARARESELEKSIERSSGFAPNTNSEAHEAVCAAQDSVVSHHALFLLRFTAGADPLDLRDQLERIIAAYEHLQKSLAQYEQVSNTAPLAIGDLADEYEDFMQIIGLCILLQRPDLLKRFAALFDNAGYRGQDTLYEDLLSHYLPNRADLDEWFHAAYTPLIHAMYATSKEQATQLLKQYCDDWYPAFEEALWHDAHLDIGGNGGNYQGYWAFEAGAVALLYGIDDSEIDHMVYPKDLVAYARCVG